jgi:uroporphyrinogen decarboxylase
MITMRENLLALLHGSEHEYVPIWLMGFDNDDVARMLNPGMKLPDNLYHNPEKNDYPWDRISDEERGRTITYNSAILKPVIVVGWGANMALGHGGPGEFHFRIEEIGEDERLLVCETGSKRLIKKNPHFYRDFDFPLKTVEEVDRLELPDPLDPARYHGFEDDISFFRDKGFYTAANLNGFFSGPHYFCIDYQEFLMSTLLDPVNSKKLIDRIGNWNISAANELLKRGVDCLVLCDDLGSSDNLLISPELYKDWILPWHTRLCALAHDYGACVHLHSHGNITKILDLVCASGIDMLDPFDIYESMDLVAFLSRNKKTVPVGGCHKFFFEWNRDMQNEYLTSLFSSANRAGGWIFMDTGGISGTVKKEDYDFFINRLRELSKR